MKDLPEYKDITDEEDRKAAYEKFIKRQQVRQVPRSCETLRPVSMVLMKHRRK